MGHKFNLVFVVLVNWLQCVSCQSGIVIIGGFTDGRPSKPTTELFSPLEEEFSRALPINWQWFYNHQSVAFRNQIYNIGGSDGMTQFYDPLTGNLSYAAPMNITRVLHSVAILNDSIVVCGGDFPGYKTCQTFDGQQWNPIAPMLQGRTGHKAVTINNRMYIFGGITKNFNLNIDMFDPDMEDNQWSTAGQMESIRYTFGIVALPNSRILLCGGMEDITWEYVTSCSAYLFNQSTGVLTSILPMAPLRTPRAYHSMVFYREMVWVVGGLSNLTTYLSTTELYLPHLNSSLALAMQLMIGRWDFTAVACDFSVL